MGIRANVLGMVVLGTVLLAGAEGVRGDDAATRRSNPETAIAPEIAREIGRLGDANPAVQTEAMQALLKIKKPAIPALIKALEDPHDGVRALAAEAIRALLKADPAGVPNSHDEAYWKRLVNKIKTGMTIKEALEILGITADKPGTRVMGDWTSTTLNLQADDYWMVVLSVPKVPNGDNDLNTKILNRSPLLFRNVRRVWFDPPKNFTGTWRTWHVNGQKAHEIHYREGKFDGTFIAFSDEGREATEVHFRQQQPHGPDRSWYRNGQKSHQGENRDGKRDGVWTHWNEKGEITARETFKNGKLIHTTRNDKK